MNIEEYISSEILESYVLGLTNKEETIQIEQLAQKQPAIKAEIEAIQTALETYTFANAKIPPKELETAIWNKIQTEENLKNYAKNKLVESSIDNQPFKQNEKRESSFSPLRMAASVLLISSILGNLYLFNRWKNTKNELSVALTQNNAIAQEAKFMKETNLAMNKEIEMFSDPAYKMVRLMGQKISPTSKLMLAWNQKDKMIYLMKSKLPAAPTGKQYQLWAIVDKKPMDLGVFDTDNNMLAMKTIENAQAFAVTLENMGGSPTPTSELYVMGGCELIYQKFSFYATKTSSILIFRKKSHDSFTQGSYICKYIHLNYQLIVLLQYLLPIIFFIAIGIQLFFIVVFLLDYYRIKINNPLLMIQKNLVFQSL